MAKPRYVVPIAAVLSALLSFLTSCYPAVSPSDIIQDATAIVTLKSVEPITIFAENEGGVLIPPESESPDSQFRLIFENSRDIPFYFELLDHGAPQSFAWIEVLNNREGVLHIEGVQEHDEFDFTLNLERADRRWDFNTPPHELFRITGMSFETGLMALDIDDGTGSRAFVWSPERDAWLARVGDTISQAVITAEAIHQNARITLAGQVGKTLPVTIPLRGDNVYSLTITALSGLTKEYKLVIVQGQSGSKDLVSFSFPGISATTEIDQADGTVWVTAPAGTDLRGLTPRIVHTGAGYTPQGPQDFTGPVVYTILAEDGSSQQYTVTVSFQVNAGTPVITGEFADAAYRQDAPAGELRVNVRVNGTAGTLHYEWFKTGTAQASGGTPVGTDSPAYTPSTGTVETAYYYVQVSNDITDNGDGGTKTAVAASRPVEVRVYRVTGVTVTAAGTEIELQGQSGSVQLSAVVAAENGPPPQEVDWQISGGSGNSGTSVNADGLLTVAADESALNLTVRAVSAADPDRYGEVTVRVVHRAGQDGDINDWGGGSGGSGSAED